MIDTHPRLYYTLILMLVLLALGCALVAPTARAASLDLRATLTANGGAVVTWSQPEDAHGLTCLYHKRAAAPASLYTCWERLPVGEIRAEIGGAGLDAAQRPGFGSEYVLAVNNVVAARTRVLGQTWLPVA